MASLLLITTVAKCPKKRLNFSAFYLDGDECVPKLIDLPKKNRIQITQKDLLPIDLKDEEYILAFLKEFGLKSIRDEMLYQTPFWPTPLLINKLLFLRKKSGTYKVNKNGRGQFMKVLAQVIKNPYEVWYVPTSISGNFKTTMRFIRIFDLEDVPFGGFSVFNLIDSGRYWSGATVFSPYTIDYLEKQRRGILLYQEDGKGFLQ